MFWEVDFQDTGGNARGYWRVVLGRWEETETAVPTSHLQKEKGGELGSKKFTLGATQRMSQSD